MPSPLETGQWLLTTVKRVRIFPRVPISNKSHILINIDMTEMMEEIIAKVICRVISLVYSETLD